MSALGEEIPCCSFDIVDSRQRSPNHGTGSIPRPLGKCPAGFLLPSSVRSAKIIRMANEISLTFSLAINKPSIMSSPIGRFVNGALFNMSGNSTVEGTMSVPTSATAIPLGPLSNPHWAAFHNLDPTNYITLFNGVAGAVFARLLATEWAVVPLDPLCVPYALANSGACLLEYLIAAQ